MASIQVRPPTSFSIKTATAGSAVSTAVTVGTSTPTASTGNLWFDTAVGFLKVYDGSNWDALGLVDSDNDGRFEFDSTSNGVSALTNGLIASFSNGGTSVFSITYDGITTLRKITGSAPSAVSGGTYTDGDDWYLGVD